MKIGMVGLPKTGKSTIFNALSKQDASVGGYSDARTGPNIATVNVHDDRVDRLSELYSPKKTIWAVIELADFAGVEKNGLKEDAAAVSIVPLIRNIETLAIVVRNFEDVNVGNPSPVEDVRILEEEFILSDLITTESRLTKIAETATKKKKTPEMEKEEKVLKRIVGQLNEMKAIRLLDLAPEERKIVRGFQFLSMKPSFVVLNSDEERFGKSDALIDELSVSHSVVEFAGAFEMELSRMSDEAEVKMFMEDIGIKESAVARLTRCAYLTTGAISFFTVGEDEVRAWTIHQGDTALTAAGTIHTDLMRGFIRAECFTCSDLLELGSEKAVKEKGRFRLEGKEYSVRDGDILSIRFNV